MKAIYQAHPLVTCISLILSGLEKINSITEKGHHQPMLPATRTPYKQMGIL
jgi:hypothetical protein